VEFECDGAFSKVLSLSLTDNVLLKEEWSVVGFCGGEDFVGKVPEGLRVDVAARLRVLSAGLFVGKAWCTCGAETVIGDFVWSWDCEGV